MDNLKLFFLDIKKIQIILLVLVLIFGVMVRFDNLAKQLPAGDDVGVISTMIMRVNHGYTIDYIKNKIYNISHEDYNTPQYKFLRKLNEQEKLESLLPYLNKVMQFVAIPQTWTYAPFQYLFYPLLISPDQDYRELLFWGRFPSFIFSVLALFLIIYFYKKIGGRGVFLQCIVSLLLLSFSWTNIIYAKHMSSYAIGVFAAILLLYIFVEILNRQRLTIWQGVLMGFILAVINNM